MRDLGERITRIKFLQTSIYAAQYFVLAMFNTFKPLPESRLKSRVLSLARANGIPADDVWQFDASKQTKRMSANVSGMFGTTRISMNDNLLNRGSPEEIEWVLGHEMATCNTGA
jgi:STE24 endopeptidase